MSEAQTNTKAASAAKQASISSFPVIEFILPILVLSRATLEGKVPRCVEEMPARLAPSSCFAPGRLHQASNDRPPLGRRAQVEIAKAVKSIHQPFSILLSGLPTGVDLEPRHPPGIEACGSFRFHFRVA